MSTATLNGPLYLTFALGTGLTIGGVGLAARRWGRWGRVGVGGGGAAVAVGAAAAFDPQLAPVASGLAAVPVGLLFLAGTRLWAAAMAALFNPRVIGGLAAVAGAAVIGGGQVWYDQAFRQLQDDDMAQLVASEYKVGEMVDVAGASAVTDRNTPVRLTVPAERRPSSEVLTFEKALLNNPSVGVHLIRRRPADAGANCHGWVFAGGRYWVASTEVDAILTENRYTEASAPAAGDLVVYRADDGRVMHTAVVRAIANDGTVLAEGKWGSMGVYLHDVSASSYGQRFAFYRSPRGGHLLRGLESAPAP